jgi:small GTP-binding protein
MADDFQYDVFISHSSKDKPTVRPLAERLRADNLRVWLDDWELKPGDSIPAKIEEGLEHSRILLLCMSAHAFGSDWTTLESQTFRFRDPLNKQRRFIPLRLDDTEPRGSLAQFLYIDWLHDDREQAYANLLEACRPLKEPLAIKLPPEPSHRAAKATQLDFDKQIFTYDFSADGRRALTGNGDYTVRLWDVDTGQCLRVLEGHTSTVWSVHLSADLRRALTGADDGTLRLWDVEAGRCLRVLGGHKERINCVVWSSNLSHALTGAWDKTLRLWDVEAGRCLRVLEGHNKSVESVAWSADGRRALSGSGDNTVRLWDVEAGRCLRVLEGHKDWIMRVTWRADLRLALSGDWSGEIRVWDVEKGQCLRVLEGHTKVIRGMTWGIDRRHVLTGADDTSLRLWDVGTGRCLRVLNGHKADVKSVMWSSDQRSAYSGDESGSIRVWDLSEFATTVHAPEVSAPVLKPAPAQVQYTNAKVLLVGESGAGKTGLSKRLVGEEWEPSDSTVGAWATQWKLEVEAEGGVEREIWLWDFGGQADQRLIHQLYMDETALAVLVFDGQREDLFETLGQWDRDLTRASQKEFAKVLVAGRVDAGGLRVGRGQVEAFARERGYVKFLETSAKADLGCKELKQAILNGIRWENIPWRSSPLLFKRLKEEIVRLKDEGRVLLRFNELRETLQLRLSGEFPRFSDEELKAVVGLLAGPGVVWELKFGSWVLLQPERINAYAQAVIQTMREDELERGCLPEERVLSGDLKYHSSKERLGPDEERFVLLAMHQTLVERGLCLRQPTERGNLLIFPSYYRRERPEQVHAPAVLVSYRFGGFLDEVYATLVVRLHHTDSFTQDQLWRYAADFKTYVGKQLGVKLTRRSPGVGELEVYFDPLVSMEEKIIFSKYIHEHLLQHAKDVERLRHYVCPHCTTPVGNREVAMKRLDAWLRDRPAEPAAAGWFGSRKAQAPTIVCSECERRVPLWDDLEQCFASPEIQQRVRDMQKESTIVLDNESKERALVGEVISTVALAGQLSREFSVSEQGLDMEIEFKSDEGEPTGRKLFLHLKSGDAYRVGRGGAGVFRIKDESRARHWMGRPFPVLLVVRNPEGEVRWMEVREPLRRAGDSGKLPPKQIAFEGERFDVMSVRRWRDRVLGGPAAGV